MNEQEKQDKIKELIKKDGVYLDKDILCFHLSPIPNWYNMMDKAEITCPVCENHKVKIEYPKEFNREKNILSIYNFLFCHRMIEYTCPKCKTKMRYENYD